MHCSTVYQYRNLRRLIHVKSVAKARSLLAFISTAFEWRTLNIFLYTYSVLVRPLLDYWVQVWAPNSARNVGKLKKFQVEEVEVFVTYFPVNATYMHLQTVEKIKMTPRLEPPSSNSSKTAGSETWHG